MAWPIPDIPEQKIIRAPKYGLWMTVLVIMLTVGIISSLWVWNVTTFAKAFFYGALPAFLCWLCLFGVVLNRYEQSVIATLNWNSETEHTKAEWQAWSRRQLAVVGNILLSPEENGMDALLGELDEVPAFPKKTRPLFGDPHSVPELMKEIDQRLEQQYPGYRYLMHSIYVFQGAGRFEEKKNQAIFEQWGIMPVLIQSIEPVESFYDSKEFDGPILIICLQDWLAQKAGQSSELISAQLITSPAFARQHDLPVIAGLTRMMPLQPGQLVNELDMLFEYNQPDKQKLKYVWLTGAAEKTAAEIMQYATRHGWMLPEKRPLYSIDLSFGPPGEMILPLSLAMLAEAANKTGADQLLVSQTPKQTGTICLITRELYA